MCGSTLDCFAQRPIWAHFHVLGNAGGEGVALAEPAPGGGEEHAAVRVLIYNMEFVKVYMGATARPPVLCYAVENRIRYNKQPHGFELLPKVENVIYQNAALVFPKQKDIKKQPMFTCLQTKEYCY